MCPKPSGPGAEESAERRGMRSANSPPMIVPDCEQHNRPVSRAHHFAGESTSLEGNLWTRCYLHPEIRWHHAAHLPASLVPSTSSMHILFPSDGDPSGREHERNSLAQLATSDRCNYPRLHVHGTSLW